MYTYSFEKLEVWKDARLFAKKIYFLTNQFPAAEKFGLSSQMQRAVVSIISNIAEGVSRNTTKEKCRFIEISFGSLMEVLSQLYVSIDLEYISDMQFKETKADVDKIANKLNALNRSFQS